jgi:hypothetical protein
MDSKVKKQNQLHPPLPKKKRVDVAGNDKRRVYFKSGNSTMLLAKGLTENGAKVVQNVLENILTDLGTKLEGRLIWTH